MEGDTSTATNGGLNSASAPAAANPSPASKESNSSPVPSMSGALEGEDVKGILEATDEAEGIRNHQRSIFAPIPLLTSNRALIESPANGTVEVPVEAPDTVIQPGDFGPAESDTGGKTTSAPGATSDAATEANGTPSTMKRSHTSKRKSTSGVPEHKTKKLNKKKSLPKITHLDAKPGEYYFARLKSYPPWPAIICDEGMLPHSLLSTRPVTTKQADGTYKEAYADGGKRVHERTFPIMFLHTNEL